ELHSRLEFRLVLFRSSTVLFRPGQSDKASLVQLVRPILVEGDRLFERIRLMPFGGAPPFGQVRPEPFPNLLPEVGLLRRVAEVHAGSVVGAEASDRLDEQGSSDVDGSSMNRVRPRRGGVMRGMATAG